MRLTGLLGELVGFAFPVIYFFIVHTVDSLLTRPRRLSLWSVPFALLALILLTYGLRALRLGFFWDDWPYLWYFHQFGAQGILDAFTSDRPFLSFIYTITLSLLGNSARAWQIFGLLAHWLCCLGLWALLALAWPRRSQQAAWVALLFAVYPGFTQNYIAIIYGQAYLLFAFTLFSMAVTLWMARRAVLTRPAWLGGTLVALLLSGLTMFSTEYFFGLELLRPLLLWLLFVNRQPALPTSDQRAAQMRFYLRDARRALAWWLPYLVLMGLFVFWRGVLHTFPGKSLVVVDGVERSPLATLARLAATIFGDLVEAGPVAWGQTLNLGHLLENAVDLRLLLVMLGVAALAFGYLLLLRPRYTADSSWALQAGGVGLFAMLAAGWPFWITGLPMHMGFPQDRYSLPLAVGVCLLLAALIDGLIKDWPRKALVLAVLLGLAGGFHFNLALHYRDDWNAMRSFFWQLTWRAPALQPNTLLLMDRLPFLYYEDDSLTAPLNWIYAPNFPGRQMPYLLYDMYVRHQSLQSLSPGLEVHRDFRATYFAGSTSQALVIDLQATGCLHVLDPLYDDDDYSLSNRLRQALPLSAPQRLIEVDAPPAQPPLDLFGAEPSHRWCYYYQKAALARQVQDWQAIPALAQASLGSGYKPEAPVELLPFIEGYARVGRYDDAYQWSVQAYEQSLALRPALCALWQRSLDAERQQGGPMGDALPAALERMNTLFYCKIQ